MVEQEITKPQSQQSLLSGSREAMEPLYEQLLSQTFTDSHSAVEFCRHACAEFGFTVKQEASANKNIYVYCSREGLPDSQRKPKPVPQRKRPSKRCDCRWRVVLSETNQGRWEFRKSTSTTAYEHNHEMMDPKEMVKAWPAQVNDYIIQLARQQRQHLQTHDIRELVKRRFPDITWNERRFYNRLTEERKRIRQREIISRVQRLLLLSARLCSVVAAAPSDEWFANVEADLTRLFDHYAQLTRLPPDAIATLVDLQPDHISIGTSDSHSTVAQKSASFSNESSNHSRYFPSSPVKMEDWDSPLEEVASRKRKSSLVDSPSIPHKGAQVVQVPPFKFYIRPHQARSFSSQQQQQQQRSPPFQLHHRLSLSESYSSPSTIMESSSSASPHPFNHVSFYSLESPSTSSLSSSASAYQQQRAPSMSSSSDQIHYRSSASFSTTATATPTSNTTSTATPPFYLPGSTYHLSQPFGGDTGSNNSNNDNDNSRHNSTGGIPVHPYYDNSHPNEMTFLNNSSLLPPPASPGSSSPPPSSGSSSSTHTSTTTSRQPLPIGIPRQDYRPIVDTAETTTVATNHSHDTSLPSASSQHPLFVYSAVQSSSNSTPTPSTTTKEGFFDSHPQSPPLPFAMDTFSVSQKHQRQQHDDTSSMEDMVLGNPSML